MLAVPFTIKDYNAEKGYKMNYNVEFFQYNPNEIKEVFLVQG